MKKLINKSEKSEVVKLNGRFLLLEPQATIEADDLTAARLMLKHLFLKEVLEHQETKKLPRSGKNKRIEDTQDASE